MMQIKKLLSKYIKNVDKVFEEVKISSYIEKVEREKINEIIDMAERYVEDAKYYLKKKQFRTGLVSIVYSEGLVDALRLLGIINFQWPEQNER